MYDAVTLAHDTYEELRKAKHWLAGIPVATTDPLYALALRLAAILPPRT